MLGSITIYGGSKGMVAMPDLAGLSRAAATSAIQAAGLVFLSSSNVSSTSANNDKVVSQSIASGSLVDYESPITFEVGLYTAPAGPEITFVEDSTTTFGVNDGDYYCSVIEPKTTKIQEKKDVRYTRKYIDGVLDTSYTPTERVIGEGYAVYTPKSTDCGYTEPSVTCTVTSEPWGQWGACTNFKQTRTEKKYQRCTDGTEGFFGDYYPVSRDCCTSSTSYTGCTSCNCTSKTCDITETTRCSTGTTSRVISTGVPVGCSGGCAPGTPTYFE